MKQAVGYCRVSSTGQEKTGTGLNRQEQTIRAYAKQAGYKIVKVYREAFTGTEIERPIFETMLTEILGNGCRVIICERLDRIARDLAIQMQIIAMLTSKGIALLDASTGRDITADMKADPMCKAMVQVSGTFAELDKSLLVRKLRKGREAKRKSAGRCEGQKPFGFYDGEAATIKIIRELYRKPYGKPRLSFEAIARELNAKKIPTRRGGKWSGVVVASIIRRK
jgi:DNA invertase Pin-like site-specific DNA recombinase